MQQQTNLVHLADLRERRRQRIAREMLRWPIWTRMPEDRPVAAAYVRRGKSYDFMASPRLNDVDLKLAAYACAVKSERPADKVDGYEIDGIYFLTIDKVHAIASAAALLAGKDLRPFVDSKYLGLPVASS